MFYTNVSSAKPDTFDFSNASFCSHTVKLVVTDIRYELRCFTCTFYVVCGDVCRLTKY